MIICVKKYICSKYIEQESLEGYTKNQESGNEAEEDTTWEGVLPCSVCPPILLNFFITYVY